MSREKPSDGPTHLISLVLSNMITFFSDALIIGVGLKCYMCVSLMYGQRRPSINHGRGSDYCMYALNLD